jgi:gliding motility-associated-like protein
MDVYVDCSEYGSGGTFALFDGFDVVGSFDGSDIITVFGINGEPVDFSFEQPSIERKSVGNGEACLEFTGDDPCILKAAYRGWIDLPVINESYYIVYQQCCRSFDVDNIRQVCGISTISDTEDVVGATYFAEITPAAQRACNVSARYRDQPPFLLCLNEPFDIAYEGIDVDGDSLSFEFYAPFVAEEYKFILRDSTIIFISPQDTFLNSPFYYSLTDLPPPYGTVDFLSPLYNAEHPLGFASELRLDPKTGRLSGTPRLWGEFLIGILIKEYRDGELINTQRREFYINTVPCLPAVVSYIDNADSTYLQEEFFMSACNGDTTVFFDNQSFNRLSIDETSWEFYLEDDTLRLSDWDVEIDFPGAGFYEGLLAAQSDEGCSDTVRLFVRIEDPITPNFEIASDSCSAQPLRFIDRTSPNPFPMEQWKWDFGDGDSSSVQHPTHAYATIGEYEARLRVGTQYCDTVFAKPISYYPAPTIGSISPDTAIFCGPSDASFIYQSQPSGDAYQTRWIFSPTDTVFAKDAQYFYDSVGVFDIRLQIISPNGCQTDSLLEGIVTILPPLEANFLVEYDSCALDSIRFFDQSQAAGQSPTSWLWNFGDGAASSLATPQHWYEQAGEKQILLTVQLGQCEAETQRTISYYPVPDSVRISPSSGIYCGTQDLSFQLANVFRLTNEYEVDWDFGDGNIGNGEQVEHVYQTAGSYSIELALTAPNGCQVMGRFENWVQINGVPFADFDYTPDDPNSANSEVQFINLSTDATIYEWNFDQQEQSIIFEPLYVFPDTGFQEVTLTVTHESGCQDSLTRVIDIAPIVQTYIASAFSPNNDGVNDVFQLQGALGGIQNYQLRIWDRWGNLLFESTDPNQVWTGESSDSTQNEVASGTYMYTIGYQDARGNPFEHIGSVVVIR